LISSPKLLTYANAKDIGKLFAAHARKKIVFTVLINGYVYSRAGNNNNLLKQFLFMENFLI